MKRRAALALIGLLSIGANLCFGQAPVPPAPTTDPPDWITAPSLSNTGDFPVSWDASATAGATYALETDSDPNFSNPTEVWSGAATSCNCTGIPNGRWYLRVKASSSSLPPSYTAADHTTCVDTSIPAPPSEPGVVSGITVPARAGAPFTVTWPRFAVISYYQLQQEYKIETPYSPMPTGPFSLSSVATVYDGANNSFLVAPVDSGGDWYRFRVRAYLLFHGYPIYGAWSSWSSMTEVADAPPDRPWMIGATGSSSGGLVTVTIGLAHCATSYEFKEDVDPGFANPVTVYPIPSMAPTMPGTVAFDVTGRTDGTYFYRVRAVNAYGASAWVLTTQGAVVTGNPAASAPAAPQAMAVPASSRTGSYYVGWTGAADASSYQLQEDVSPAFTSPADITPPAGSLQVLRYNPADGTFYYRVRAVNSIGTSAWCDAANPCVVALSSSLCYVAGNYLTAQYDDILPGSTGKVALSMKLTADSAENTSFESFTLTASGSGDDLADVSQLKLYVDSNSDGLWTEGVDALLRDSVTFSADNGTAVFSALGRVIPAGGFEKWFVVADFAGTAAGGEDFLFEIGWDAGSVTAVSEATGRAMIVSGYPVRGTKFTVYADDTPGALYAAKGSNPPQDRELPAGSQGAVMAAFTLTAGEREGVRLNSLTIEGSGTGDDASGVWAVYLYEDLDADGLLTAGSDRLMGTPGLFAADDGVASIALPGETLPALCSRRVLVVFDLSPLAAAGGSYTATLDTGRIDAVGLVSLRAIPVDGLPVTGCTVTVETPAPPPPAPSGGCGASSLAGASSAPGAAIPLLLLAVTLACWRRRALRS